MATRVMGDCDIVASRDAMRTRPGNFGRRYEGMEIICIRTVLTDVYPLLRKDRPRVARNAYLTWLCSVVCSFVRVASFSVHNYRDRVISSCPARMDSTLTIQRTLFTIAISNLQSCPYCTKPLDLSKTPLTLHRTNLLTKLSGLLTSSDLMLLDPEFCPLIQSLALDPFRLEVEVKCICESVVVITAMFQRS
jgi:hypothetical protein